MLDIFRREFDAAYEEGGIFQLTMHPHIIGYRSRIWILEELIRHAKSRASVWFATHAEVARLRQGARGVSKVPSSPEERAASAVAARSSWRRAATTSRWSTCSSPRCNAPRARSRPSGRKALTYKADVSAFARAHEIAEDVAKQWGRIDSC